MITDKLLAFNDNDTPTISSGAGDSATLDFGKCGDEIARTLNLVAQVDSTGTSPTTTNTIAVTLKGKKASDSTWEDIQSFPAVAISALPGYLVNFAKLPLGMSKYTALKLAYTVKTSASAAGTIPSDMKFSAWLTPSVEA